MGLFRCQDCRLYCVEMGCSQKQGESMKRMVGMVLLSVTLMACAPAASDAPSVKRQLVLLDETGAPVTSYTVERDGLQYTFDPNRFMDIAFKVSNHNGYAVQLLWGSSQMSSPRLGTTSIYLPQYGTDLDHFPETQVVEGRTSVELRVMPKSQMHVSHFQAPDSWNKTTRTVGVALPRPFLSEQDPWVMNLVWNIQGSLRTHSFSFKQKTTQAVP